MKSFTHRVETKYKIHSFTNKKIVYHGTDHIFKKFDPAKRELGFHFAENKEQAERRGKNIMVAQIDLKNPLELTSDLGDWSDMEMLEEYLIEWEVFTKKQFSKFKNVNDVRDGLEQLGYDGIIYENRFEGSGESYIVFHPEQIKILKILKI